MQMRVLSIGAYELKHQAVQTTLYSLSAEAPARPNRRTGERYLSLLRVGAMLVEGRRELCLIRNISAGGMMIRPYSPLSIGSRVSVELKQGSMVSGTAKWTDQLLVGISFEEPIDVLSLLAAPRNGSQPRMPRIEVESLAFVREDATIHRTQILNMSQGGICVRTTAALKPGATVTISVAGLPPMGGLVKWTDAETSGIGFNQVLTVTDLMRFLRERQCEKRRAR